MKTFIHRTHIGPRSWTLTCEPAHAYNGVEQELLSVHEDQTDNPQVFSEYLERLDDAIHYEHPTLSWDFYLRDIVLSSQFLDDSWKPTPPCLNLRSKNWLSEEVGQLCGEVLSGQRMSAGCRLILKKTKDMVVFREKLGKRYPGLTACLFLDQNEWTTGWGDEAEAETGKGRSVFLFLTVRNRPVIDFIPESLLDWVLQKIDEAKLSPESPTQRQRQKEALLSVDSNTFSGAFLLPKNIRSAASQFLVQQISPHYHFPLARLALGYPVQALLAFNETDALPIAQNTHPF